MSKQYRIKWRDNDQKELERAVQNFNAKISRIAKKNPQIAAALPEKVQTTQLREMIRTRQDLKREINALRRFSNKKNVIKVDDNGKLIGIVDVPDNDNNLKMTKWQRTEMNRRVAVINRRREKRLEEISNLEATLRGQGLGYKVGEVGMGKQTELALKPMKAFTPGMNRTWLKKKFQGIIAESQSDYFEYTDEILKQNIITAITQNYNPEDVKDVIESINSMDAREILHIYQKEGGNFEDFYPDDLDKYQAQLKKIKSYWIRKKK